VPVTPNLAVEPLTLVHCPKYLTASSPPQHRPRTHHDSSTPLTHTFVLDDSTRSKLHTGRPKSAQV
jgi:hypothetical protein